MCRKLLLIGTEYQHWRALFGTFFCHVNLIYATKQKSLNACWTWWLNSVVWCYNKNTTKILQFASTCLFIWRCFWMSTSGWRNINWKGEKKKLCSVLWMFFQLVYIKNFLRTFFWEINNKFLFCFLVICETRFNGIFSKKFA